jgi:DNA-binding transcriptional MerR regulator
MSIFDEFQTRPQIAKEFRVSKQTIRLWERNYGLPVVKLGQHRLYDPVRVREWFLSRQHVEEPQK